jgi:hypothetical protein
LIAFTLDDPCPCNSGRRIRDCTCEFHEGRFYPAHVNIRPPGPVTGFSHPRCYAGLTNDCSHQLSREHAISHAVLRELANERGFSKVKGLRWQGKDNEFEFFPTTALASKVLCKRHNEALSPLDTIGVRFFNTFNRIDDEIRDPKLQIANRLFTFNGDVIERWMLKTLCGFLASKNIDSPDGYNIPLHWVEILFCDQEMPPECGLYCNSTLGQIFETRMGFAMGTLSSPSGPYAARVTLNSKDFVLSMLPPAAPRSVTLLQDAVFRPDELCMEYRNCKKVVQFAWRSAGEGGAIHFNYTGSGEEGRREAEIRSSLLPGSEAEKWNKRDGSAGE